MHILKTLLPALLLSASVSAVPVEDTTVQSAASPNHGTPAEVLARIKENWYHFQEVNGTDIAKRSLSFAETMEENFRLSEDARRLGKRCTWNDGHGPIDCGYFSIVFGLDGPGKWGTRQYFHLKANNFDHFHEAKCDRNGDTWSSFTSPLPWTVDVHPGNACLTNLADIGAWWDNLWIKYAHHFVNAPTDTRCGPVHAGGYGRRCIIAK